MKNWRKALSAGSALVIVTVLLLVVAFTDVHYGRMAVEAQGNPGITTINPNVRYPAMVFTATSQTVKQPIGGIGSATVEIYGPATAATLQLKCSNDGGANYFAVPFSTGAYTSNVLSVVTGAAFAAYSGTPTLYWVNLADFTNCEVVSSGTFTGASASVQITGSSNKGLF